MEDRTKIEQVYNSTHFYRTLTTIYANKSITS